jgi:1-acyl-sn-glycerol-3-phosphate acyltransferase
VPRYVILSRLTDEGRRGAKLRIQAGGKIREEVEALDGKLIDAYALLGEYDFCTIAELPNNTAALLIGSAHSGVGGVERVVLPAIDLPLFVRLVGQTTETTGPHRWQVTLPARLARRAVRPWVLTRWGNQFFDPLVIDGRERIADLRGSAIFIANHSSHLDSPAFTAALPGRYKDRTYFGSAADRWFIKGRKEFRKQGWWRSLAYASFPIVRGGGSKSLDYADWLISHGNSIGIFPEGTRSTTGRMGKFRAGAAILALRNHVPVVPMYMDGLGKLMPKGGRGLPDPGPVRVLIGDPIRFESGTDVSEATRTLYRAMEALRKECREERHAKTEREQSEAA